VRRVTVHYAQSLDGRLATVEGDSQWIGGPASLRLAHRLRAEHEHILVGVGTVLADNPRLTVRLVEGRSPRRVVLDSTLRLPLEVNLLTDGAAPTVVATTARAPAERVRLVRERGVEVLVVPEDECGRVDLALVLDTLKIESVLVEGGAAVITSALRQRLVNRLVVCIAPRVIGQGIEAVGDLHTRRLGEALAFRESRFEVLDDDVIFDGSL
jgi:5-amino-6-(5-phosphoribosylamino)uracil reductase/diaminohydroxyphosphoribosylaminopyrimidine deaminase/5-amino-6-(5-phosphoribosylamino)uracil reductase